ncbi:MAG: tRNA uridine-5-carboxymethylaminomethyl(34) synthesis GTPase MnmE [Pseudomonadota bacterium]
MIDRGIVLWFPAPRSFTGEAMAELQVHGGRSVIEGVLEALADCPGLRPAEPGEFTRRAFDNGKLDLSEVEGLADLIAAETAAQRRQALQQMDGGLSRLTEGWRARLLPALARLEATIDFSDEELPEGLVDSQRGKLEALLGELDAALADESRGERLRSGVQIAVLGPPNVGKSTLLNALAKRDVAIVSSQPGTTRDVIEVHLDLGGYPVTLADTAGLREGHGSDVSDIEREGMRRARQRAGAADLKLVVTDARSWPTLDPATRELIDDDSIVALNKIDLVPTDGCIPDDRIVIPISAKTGKGVPELLSLLKARVAELLTGGTEAPAITRIRHRQAVVDCRDALARSLSTDAPELIAEDLRLAVRALGRITGRVDVEDLLDVIFQEFCIGK